MVIPVIKVHIFHYASDARVDKLFERRVCLNFFLFLERERERERERGGAYCINFLGCLSVEKKQSMLSTGYCEHF